MLSYKLVITRIRAKSIARIDSIGVVERNSNLSFIKIDFNKMTKYIKQNGIKMSFSMFKFFSKKKMNDNKQVKNNKVSDIGNTNFSKARKIKNPQKRQVKSNDENSKIKLVKKKIKNKKKK